MVWLRELDRRTCYFCLPCFCYEETWSISHLCFHKRRWYSREALSENRPEIRWSTGLIRFELPNLENHLRLSYKHLMEAQSLDCHFQSPLIQTIHNQHQFLFSKPSHHGMISKMISIIFTMTFFGSHFFQSNTEVCGGSVTIFVVAVVDFVINR